MQALARTSLCVIVAAIAAAATTVPAEAAVIIDSLMIRVYDTAGVLAGDRARAMRVAADALASARIYIEWRDCTPAPAGAPPVECQAVPRSGDLLVRIGDAPARISHGMALSLGYSLIDTQSGRGTLATIYRDRVNWLAAQAHAPATRLLGRAIAHELGHLVLGSNEHSENGLMRAVWTAAEVARNRPSDWRFSAGYRAGMLNAWLNGGNRSDSGCDVTNCETSHPESF
jgi:hypothetical protein